MGDCASEALELDRLYNEIAWLYHEFARSGGVSDCAYWTLYALAEADDAVALRDLCAAWSFSKQTVSSTLKSLEAKRLIRLDHVEGSRKSKKLSLTSAGRAFCEAHVAPAMRAEKRAFDALKPRERTMLVNLVRRYADALAAETRAALGAPASRYGTSDNPVPKRTADAPAPKRSIPSDAAPAPSTLKQPEGNAL